MRLDLFLLVAVAGLAADPVAASAPGELTGDTKLACEAILCLSSPARPQECNTALQRYFTIQLKRWSDTVNARRDFLKLCPASSDTDKNMPVLVNSIASGAGQCDAAHLNQSLAYLVRVQECLPGGDQRSGAQCVTKTIRVIGSKLPADCAAYTTNAYTYNLGVTYVSEPMKGGHWVDNATTAEQ